jgi:hypothetical protein
MRPTYASCNSCHARLQLFGEERPEKCPKCSNLIRYEEYGKCESCSGKVLLGVTRCVACRMSADPTFSGEYPANGPGIRGGVN